MLGSSAVDRCSNRRERLADLLLDPGGVGVGVGLAMWHTPDAQQNTL